jgi:hypothetical protein
LGGLNKLIEFGQSMVNSTQENLNQSQASLAIAQAASARLSVELTTYQQLKAQLDGYVPALTQLSKDTAQLQKDNLQVRKHI